MGKFGRKSAASTGTSKSISDMGDDDVADVSPPSPTACALFFLLLMFVKIASDIDNGTSGGSKED